MHWILYLAILTGPMAGNGGAFNNGNQGHTVHFKNKAACEVVHKQQAKEISDADGVKEGTDFTLTCKLGKE